MTAKNKMCPICNINCIHYKICLIRKKRKFRKRVEIDRNELIGALRRVYHFSYEYAGEGADVIIRNKSKIFKVKQ